MDEWQADAVRALEAAAKRFSFGGLMRGVVSEIQVRVEYSRVVVGMCCVVPDRTTGVPIRVAFRRTVSASNAARHPVETISHLLAELWEHEFSEAVRVDGALLADPHADGGGR
jgi:hypothetical protein